VVKRVGGESTVWPSTMSFESGKELHGWWIRMNRLFMRLGFSILGFGF